MTVKLKQKSNSVQQQSYSNADAAVYLGVSENSLRQSRISGGLCGVDAPKYLKMGRLVRYKISTLKTWLDQFQEQQA